MAVQTKTIRQKIKSIGNIRKITKTMEMVSVSKMRRSIDRAVASRTYARLAAELLSNIAGGALTHPYLAYGTGSKELIVIFASNKGLCGGYHTNLSKALVAHLAKAREEGREASVVTIGKQGEKMAIKLKLPIVASFIHFSEYSSPNEVRALMDVIIKEYTTGAYHSVSLAYTQFVKMTTHIPSIKTLLPVMPEMKASKAEVEYTFEPGKQQVLDKVVPHVIEVTLFQSMLESFASEHSARMFAMKNASDNASSLLEDLSLAYNHARQDGITSELSEIVSGANALQAQ